MPPMKWASSISTLTRLDNAVKDAVASVKEQAKSNPEIKVNDIDGARVMTPEGWWLIRASNTQNVLVTRAEARTPNGLETLKSMVQKEVKGIGYDVSFGAQGH